MRIICYALALLTAAGCHAKFKKHAGTLGDVKVKTITTGGPQVVLGKVSEPGLVGQIVNVAQTIKEVNQTARIAKAVKIDNVNDAMQQGVIDTIGSGPPFAATPDSANLLQLDVLSYGLVVPTIGDPGTFNYKVRARIYDASGDRVYSSRLTCSTGVGDPSATEVVLGVVNNVRELKDMKDRKINKSFMSIAEYCGGYFVTRMRKHAG